jgi:peptidoglycan/LPS O-acetylase OafA/YrhL
MGPLDLLNHLLNFSAPAVAVGGLMALTARVFYRSRHKAPGIWAQAAINSVACAVVLFIGLWFFGRDGKMATYAAMVLVGTVSQGLFLRDS